ncbi:predicted protein [Naegleria gruberi]|uniref:Predicted protein n=1 Tax=Naegleria gruberi TaxID=5762 RepID=D2V4N3_NAEGR|nr:uncharacterized protein NAEGRDRAFT_63851 [Naegleria gruberi]EFC47961.1 predicted protein [Naegleria gruberi]|eukprot:XP_002680705.1 predicted protein [Naegleria gruberi strain NEG-M]
MENTSRLEKFRVRDGFKFNSSIEITQGQPRNLVSMDRENMVAITNTKNDDEASYLSVVIFKSGLFETTEIIPPRYPPNLAGCDFPLLSGSTTNFKIDTYEVEVSCTDNMDRVYNVFTTSYVVNYNQALAGTQVKAIPKDFRLGLTKLSKSHALIAKNIQNG